MYFPLDNQEHSAKTANRLVCRFSGKRTLKGPVEPIASLPLLKTLSCVLPVKLIVVFYYLLENVIEQYFFIYFLCVP